MNNTCVQCDAIIPEGIMVCPNCEITQRICPGCGKHFSKTSGKQAYCSAGCRIKESNMRARIRAKIPGYKKPQWVEQPCWTCQNATGGCSWSKDLTPIKGWKATNTDESYAIRKCPEYIKDDGNGIMVGDESGELAKAVVMSGVNDYRKALEILKDRPNDKEALLTRQECESFFRSGWFTALTTVDPQFMIDKINKEVGI